MSTQLERYGVSKNERFFYRPYNLALRVNDINYYILLLSTRMQIAETASVNKNVSDNFFTIPAHFPLFYCPDGT